MIVLFASFVILLAATLRSPAAREAMRTKAADAWIVDLANLTVQGVIVPAVELAVVVAGLRAVAPGMAGVMSLPSWASFLLNVVVVDYLYYWNHRLLHTRALWPTHQLHHTSTAMDVFATSRNTLWTSFLIVYVWVNGALLFLLADPAPFAAGATLTAILDLWRHSEVHPPAAGWLRGWVVLPADHARHHATDAPPGNYGANWMIWDRLHGTALAPAPVDHLGVPPTRPMLHALIWPFP